MASHFEPENRQCKAGRQQQVTDEDAAFLFLAQIGPGRCMTARIYRMGLITCLADSRDQVRNVGAARDRRAFGGEIDRRTGYARDRFQSTL